MTTACAPPATKTTLPPPEVTTDGLPPRLPDSPPHPPLATVSVAPGVCRLCRTNRKRQIGTTGVDYCPHCDTVCPLGKPESCPACAQVDAQ